MTEEQFDAMVIERVKAIVDCISKGDFDKLSALTLSIGFEDEEPEKDGAEWLQQWFKEVFELWGENHGKEYVVDSFNEMGLELDERDYKHTLATYHVVGHGEFIPLWFIMDMYLNDNNEFITEFVVNI